MKKLLLISFILSLLGCTKFDSIKKDSKQGVSIGNLVRRDLVIKMPNFSSQNSLTKSQNQSTITPVWDSAFTVITKSGTKILVPLDIDNTLKMYSFTNSKMKTYRNPIRGYLFFSGIQTKGDGDDDPTVIMVGDDEISSDGMYTGVFTYSNPSGDVLYSCIFENSTLKYLIVPDSLQGTTPNFYRDTTVSISLFIEQGIWERSLNDDAVCVALRPTIDFSLDRYTIPHTQHILSFWNMMMPDHLSGASGNNEERVESNITITLEAGTGGIVKGGGTYPPAYESVTIEAIPDLGYRFVMWSGDFSGKPSAFSIPLTRNMSGKAFFIKANPCISLSTFKSNPLFNMNIVPTKNADLILRIVNGDYKGRNGEHDGIDLGIEGEPIYAMFDGRVSRVVDIYDSDLPYAKYPERSSTSSCGNRVEYICNVNGQTIKIQCWHMQKGIIVNMNDIINAGDILGYVGKTGSASSIYSSGPHLHLQIQNLNSFGIWEIVNPHNYIYSTYTKDSQGRIISINPTNNCLNN